MKKLIIATSLLIGSVNIYATQTAQTLIEQNGCMACHEVASRKTAPAFAGIAKRNLRFSGAAAKDIIIHTIKHGSSGKYRRFSNNSMPAYPSLSNDQLQTIADYILLQASKAKGGGGMGYGKHKGGGY